MKEGGRPMFPSQLGAPKESPPPSPVTLGSRDRAAAKSSKEITVGHEGNDQPDAVGRHFVCKIVKSLITNFLGRGLRWERGREEESIFSCHGDTEVTLCRALPATRTHPLFLPE